MKLINHLLIAGALLAGIGASAQYVPDPAFTNDFAGRTGHSNSNLTNPAGAGFMQAPKCIVQSGSYVYVAGKTVDDQFIYGGYILNKKHATTGANPLLIKLNYGLLTTGTVNSDDIWVYAMTPDANSDRLYVVGRTSATDKGIVLCFKLSTLALETGFNGTGILLMETGSAVFDIVMKDVFSLLSVRNIAGEIRITEISIAGVTSTTSTLSASGKTYKSTRIKSYPGLANRFFITGSCKDNTSGVTSPGVWGVDYVAGGHGGTSSIVLRCENAMQLSTEGPGEFLDLCFPYNSNTQKYDIVCVGKTNAVSIAGSGIFVKYKGNTTTGPIFNMALDNTFKNQASLPGTGYASNISDPTNMTVFSGCEVIGTQIAVSGSHKVGSADPHDAQVGMISSTGGYTSIYIAPYSTNPTYSGNVVHYPGRLCTNAQSQIFVVGCDYGLSAFKLKP
ncbi:hypothetical protein [Fluviicola sp.]|uniref:hypothetical protein n=1 Tax=Fluviicola sp. TaxID=1917219 RepID=UPI0031DEF9E6